MNKKQETVNKEQEALLQQIAELTEALQRERADSDNIRRRHEEQMASLKTMVKANVVRELLPVIDNFERALKHSPVIPTPVSGYGVNSVEGSRQKTGDLSTPLRSAQDDKQLQDWLKGVMSIKAQFDKTLADMGVERIKTVGQVFDPRLHEAVSMEEGAGTVEVISEELQAGYTLGQDVIRHAMVRVKMQTEKK